MSSAREIATGVKVFPPHPIQAGLGPVETAKAARISQVRPQSGILSAVSPAVPEQSPSYSGLFCEGGYFLPDPSEYQNLDSRGYQV